MQVWNHWHSYTRIASGSLPTHLRKLPGAIRSATVFPTASTASVSWCFWMVACIFSQEKRQKGKHKYAAASQESTRQRPTLLLIVWKVTCAYALRNFLSRLTRLYYLRKAVKERDFATGNASALNSGIYAPTSSLDGLRCVLAVSVIEDFGKNLAECWGKYGFKSTDRINNWTAQTAGRHGLSSAVTSGLRKAAKTYAIFCKVNERQLSRVVTSCCKSGWFPLQNSKRERTPGATIKTHRT